MKRFTLSVVLTGVLGLAAYTFSGAQPPAGPERGARPRGGPGGRGGIALLRDANLTDDQKAAIKAIRDADRTPDQNVAEDAQLRRQLQAEVFADAPDAQKIASLLQQLSDAQSERLAKQIATDQKIAQVLTAEQRAKIRERLSQRPSDRRGARGAGGPERLE